MKQKILKSFLCLSLSAAMVFGEAGAAFATTVTDTPEVEVAVETQTVNETEMTEEGEAAAVEEPSEGETAEAAAAEETAETEEITVEAAEDEAQQEETDDVLEALGAKIVDKTVLADVSGLAYDTQTKILSWNKVAGATSYKYEISYVDESGNTKKGYNSTTDLYLDLDSSLRLEFGEDYYDYFYLNMFSTPDRTYTVKVSAINYAELYQVAANVAGSETRPGHWDEEQYDYVYDGPRGIYKDGKLFYEKEKDYDVADEKSIPSADGTTTTYTLYKYPASANQASKDVKPYTAADVADETPNTTSITQLTSVAVKELRGESVYFTVTPAAKLKNGEKIQYTYSNNDKFKNGSSLNGDGDEQLFATTNTDSRKSDTSETDWEFSVPLSAFNPGDTIYVKVRTRNEYYELKPGQTEENRCSAEKTTSYSVPKAEITGVSTTVTGSSIRLKADTDYGNITGFEYQRKNGKKWITLAKQGGAYTDEGLKADTQYTYRVRGYFYNTRTKKTTTTDWKQVSAYTWGAALKLKAAAASATSVKLSWSKISNADGYEIYRYDTNSAGYNSTKNWHDDYFENATLIKTIKKAKTTSYTDKKLTKGNTYTYLVRAYRTVGKNKFYIDGKRSVTLSGKGTIDNLDWYYNASGKLVVTWNKATGISGYKVEKQNAATGKWESYKNLGKAATTITLPNVSVGSESVEYRISSYNGKKVYDRETITVYPQLAAVKNVKATKTADGVKVTWSKVPGADYYQVYRSTKAPTGYDATTKTYDRPWDATSVYDTYRDTSSFSFANISKTPGQYEYDPNLNSWNNRVHLGYIEDSQGEEHSIYAFYNWTTSYRNSQITGTSVVDKPDTVKRLVNKYENPAYNKAADPEYDNVDGSYKTSYYGEFEKNADGSLKTVDYVLNKSESLQAGNTYYYYVVAYAKPANGANANDEITSSIGCTKPAEVTYTAKTAKATKLSSAKSTKKATVVVSAKKVSGAKGYAFYRSTKKNGTYVKVGTNTKPTYTDTNVTGGKTYYYKTASYTLTENGTFVYSKLSAAKSVKAKK